MANGDSAFDTVLAGGTLASTSITNNGAMLAAVEGISGGERDDAAPVFSALGAGGRPLPPDDDGEAEVVCARASDGLPVIAQRDLRIEKGRAAPLAEGSVYFAGYHGAEVCISRQSAGVSIVTVRDSSGEQLVVAESGVRQGDDTLAKDVLLAQPAIDLLNQIGSMLVTLYGVANALAPGSVNPAQIAQFQAALLPFLASGTPNAPTTRAPKLRGEPGA